MIGETIFTFTSVLIVWSGKIPWGQLFALAFTLIVSNIGYNIIMVGPATFIVNWLKKAENVDVYDTYLDYNPFKI